MHKNRDLVKEFYFRLLNHLCHRKANDIMSKPLSFQDPVAALDFHKVTVDFIY